MNFKAKNLTYDKNEPAFLRRLRSQYGDGTGERHGRSNVRPIKPKDPDADDEPTYVDEESNEVISKEEYQAMLRNAEENTSEQPTSRPENGDQNQNSTSDKTHEKATEPPELAPSQKVAEIGGAKKKKLARVIADDDDDDDDQPAKKDAQVKVTGPPKKRQKKKKIKLSFDEETET
ncbi:hypothetical protein D8B26_007742 [Coccidioides posadasii str. Silveira]|uniref:Uncharacterized protein n=1 Tax=Coccidioides posadasii (strain RMSCC 757 / Silveira) TaxID=443226 RepID=E9D2V6_COCPS|nr:conserved hypothetical protein [Coccidioides posadasii str. Silveira]QVM13126.1 hypothetical protein D8B26_007742 [Coccidioides posadasii str. Silveira]